MDVELLVVPDCAHEAPTHQLLRLLLDECGLSHVDIRVRIVESEAQARELAFVGSPTVRIDGADPYPPTAAAYGLACRLYRVGCLFDGVPDADVLRRAIQTAISR
jgi:hypothetical protein